MARKPRILACCTGNINRSAAFDVILNHLGEGEFEVKSCGTGKVAPHKCKIPRKMRLVLQGMGYDPEGHRSTGISEELLGWSDIVVVMGNVHEKHIANHYPDHLSKVENWKIKDPHFAKGDEMHRAVAAEIEERIKQRFLQ